MHHSKRIRFAILKRNVKFNQGHHDVDKLQQYFKYRGGQHGQIQRYRQFEMLTGMGAHWAEQQRFTASLLDV